jgi:hypothetical protein
VPSPNDNIVMPLTRLQASDWYGRYLRAIGDNGSVDDEHELLVEIADDIAVAIGEIP